MTTYCNPFGITMYTCSWLPETIYKQVRFPRSKKKRIRTKWFKDSRNWAHVPAPMMYIMTLPPEWFRFRMMSTRPLYMP